jgi:polar amino acid transport system permease protein
MRRVLLPQAFVAMLPPLGNLMVELLKATALVSVIAVPDLLGRALRWRDHDLGRIVGIFGLVLLVYFGIGQAVRLGVAALERRAGRFRAGERGR